MTEDTFGRLERSFSGAELDPLESAAQTFEAIASGLVGDSAKVRDIARAQALRLRSEVSSGQPGAEGFDRLLAGLSVDFAEIGLVVEYSTSGISDISGEVWVSLKELMAEALSDVFRFTEARKAIVRAIGTRGGIEITVRDHGRPVESNPESVRIGPSRPLRTFLEGIGGTISIWSERDRGTRVYLFLPCR